MSGELGGYDCNLEDDYINMEVSSYSVICHSICSPTPQTEFEFQMSLNSLQKQTTTSPADELFYQGKLLPLHLPPRLQMVNKLLEETALSGFRADAFGEPGEVYSTPLMTPATTPTATSTPFRSCNISPSGSCGVSRELNPEEYFAECSSEGVRFGASENLRKPWTRKLKLMKQSSVIGTKLKASGAYLKSWFGKSSADSCKGAARVADEGTMSRASESLNSYVKVTRRIPFGQIHREKYAMAAAPTNTNKQDSTDGSCQLHRRSFSMAIKRNQTSKSSAFSSLSGCSSSTRSSDSSKEFHRLPFLKRSTSSTSSEIENPIQGAIAHCKKSQQPFLYRKSCNQ